MAMPLISSHVRLADTTSRYRNINLFDLRLFTLPIILGSTYSWLTNSAMKTLPIQRNGFSPFFLLLTPRFSSEYDPPDFIA